MDQEHKNKIIYAKVGQSTAQTMKIIADAFTRLGELRKDTNK